MYEDRFPAVEAYLRDSFPEATVYRVHRADESYIENVQGHSSPAQMWRAIGLTRNYDLAITDDALEELTADRLAHLLRYNAISSAMLDCPESERVWLLSGAVRTLEKLGESPID